MINNITTIDQTEKNEKDVDFIDNNVKNKIIIFFYRYMIKEYIITFVM
jgi:hypothetical protein